MPGLLSVHAQEQILKLHAHGFSEANIVKNTRYSRKNVSKVIGRIRAKTNEELIVENTPTESQIAEQCRSLRKLKGDWKPSDEELFRSQIKTTKKGT